MSAWDTDDYGGLMGILLGIIVLTFSGILVALVIERRTNASRADITLEAEISRNAELIADLRSNGNELRERWDQDHVPNLEHDTLVRELRTTLDETLARQSSLRNQAEDLRSAIGEIEEQAGDYRRRYRIQARADAVGQTIALLKLGNGRSYKDAVIRNCGPEGIQIHHDGGSARVAYADLPDDWKHRLQWNPLEEKADAGNEPAAEVVPKPADPPKPEAKDPDAERDERERLRTRILAARDAVRRYHGDYVDAKRMAATARSRALGPDRSVPGSLETWEERAIRMENVAAKARTLFLKARTDLAALSPRDPLLTDVRYR